MITYKFCDLCGPKTEATYTSEGFGFDVCEACHTEIWSEASKVTQAALDNFLAPYKQKATQTRQAFKSLIDNYMGGGDLNMKNEPGDPGEPETPEPGPAR